MRCVLGIIRYAGFESDENREVLGGAVVVVWSPLEVEIGRGTYGFCEFNDNDESVAERSDGDSAAATEGIARRGHAGARRKKAACGGEKSREQLA